MPPVIASLHNTGKMGRDQLTLVFLVILSNIIFSNCQNQTSCTVARNCRECLKRDPHCAWCTDDAFNVRCDLEDSLITNGCANITNPRGTYDVIKDDPLGDAKDSPINKTVQVQPQHIQLTLRAGEPQTVTMYTRLAKDYPLDVYYLMDLSKSMFDDLLTLRRLGRSLVIELQKLSSDVQMGFGSFVDKEIYPFVYTDPEQLELSCNPPDAGSPIYQCAAAFGFSNGLNLTSNLDKFSEKLESANYSTSITRPEGGMDALMQIIACKDFIEWRNGARRLLVYTSDSTIHVAGDARLASIFTPNDGLCHIDPTTNKYTMTDQQDFPTIGQLNSKIIEHNIYPIFAINAAHHEFYQSMAKFITGMSVGVLYEDSRNIVNIIKEVYSAITSKIELIDNAPEGINVHYTAHCGDGDDRPGEKTCTGLSLGQVVSFDLNITATSCEENRPQRFYVKPFGLKDLLLIEVDVICSCECESKGIPESDLCSDGNGTLACGVCYCNPNRYGQQCECDIESGTGEGIENCRESNSSVICSGRGECFCGECQCFQRQDPKEVISGPLCECDNFSCDRYEGELCGGPKRGKCICDEKTWSSKCQCNKGFIGNACQCPDTDAQCIATTGLICNGFGTCDCGQCLCDENSSFRGPTCEDCGICKGDCGVFRECVMCTVFQEGRLSPEECARCSMLIVVENKLQFPNGSLRCETLNEANCTVVYYYETLQNGTVLVHVQKNPVCPQRVVTKVEPWIIVVAIICAILFIGLLLILLFRIYIYYLDKREFAAFEKDRKEANWKQSTNPIYKPSTTRHANPMYGKAVQMEYHDEPKTDL